MKTLERACLVTAALAMTSATACTRPMTQSSSVATPVAGARQLVVVTTPDWNATSGTLRRFNRESGSSDWMPAGDPIPVVIGRTGLAWGDQSLATSMQQPIKHEGDGKAPAGAFPLDTAFGF